MLFLVVVYFIKPQTLLNNIPEGNPFKSVYLTPKIALIFSPMSSLNGRVATKTPHSAECKCNFWSKVHCFERVALWIIIKEDLKFRKQQGNHKLHEVSISTPVRPD